MIGRRWVQRRNQNAAHTSTALMGVGCHGNAGAAGATALLSPSGSARDKSLPPGTRVSTRDTSPLTTDVTAAGSNGGSGGGGGSDSKRPYDINSASSAADPLCDQQVLDESADEEKNIHQF